MATFISWIPPNPRNHSGGSLVECCFTSTETVGLLGAESRTATSTSTQFLSSDSDGNSVAIGI